MSSNSRSVLGTRRSGVNIVVVCTDSDADAYLWISYEWIKLCHYEWYLRPLRCIFKLKRNVRSRILWKFVHLFALSTTIFSFPPRDKVSVWGIFFINLFFSFLFFCGLLSLTPFITDIRGGSEACQVIGAGRGGVVFSRKIIKLPASVIKVRYYN